MSKPKILYISQEIAPYLPSSPIADLCRSLPQDIQSFGYEVRTFMPKYGIINERRNQLHEVIRLSGMNIIIDDSDHPLIIKVATLLPSRMQVYFIDNDDYFQHHGGGLTDLEIRVSPDDNDERIIFFARGVIETVKKLKWEAAVIHSVGWVSALAPLYLRHIYHDNPAFRASKLVYSLTADKFEGTFDPRFKEKLFAEGFSAENLAVLGEDAVDWITLNKLAIDNSDAIVVSTPEPDAQLLEYARASGKPVLEFIEEKPEAAHAEFYANLNK